MKHLRFVPTGPAESAGSSLSEVVVRNAIVRACRCGSPRSVGAPCAGCGTTAPPRIDDLGVVSTWYRNPVKRMWWKRIGAKAAHRRTTRLPRAENIAAHPRLVLLPPLPTTPDPGNANN